MSKPVIAIDVDDVLAHSIESFRLQVNARAGAQLTREHFMVPGEYHHYLDRVLETNGVDYATIKDDLFLGMSNDQSHIPPQPGAVKVLQKLAREYELVVITARAPEWEAQTHVWLQMHFPGVFKEVHPLATATTQYRSRKVICASKPERHILSMIIRSMPCPPKQKVCK
jgi:5'(3')-deoxyribonucleotidase